MVIGAESLSKMLTIQYTVHMKRALTELLVEQSLNEVIELPLMGLQLGTRLEVVAIATEHLHRQVHWCPLELNRHVHHGQ